MNQHHHDVIIIGAGLSGIGVASQLAKQCPNKDVRILERRERMGGTWDLFRYPGIRSDSDMCSFGYRFRPWNELKVLADGPSIRQYIADTAADYGVDKKVQYGLKILNADWSSRQQLWTVTALHEQSGETQQFTCSYLVSCTGYYNHDAGHRPEFPGQEQFKGLTIHPQQWPEDLDYSGKKVVVIGSGATAVTLVPSMTDEAEHVTMIQRSPSYVFSLPSVDKLTGWLSRVMPERWAYRLARKRNIWLQRAVYLACRRWPETMRGVLLKQVRKHVGPDFDMRHFSPKYMPWDERLCAVPDADLFKVLRSGKASIETDQIETWTETGIQLKSGKHIEADIIITATGLNLQMLGGLELSFDGQPRPFGRALTYKGVLLEGMPNMAWIFGYTNSSWTLKLDVAANYICRVLNHMDTNDLAVCVPRDRDNNALEESVVDSLQSGYVQRGKHLFPRQGEQGPWELRMHYRFDRKRLGENICKDGVLEFEPRAGAEADLSKPAVAAA